MVAEHGNGDIPHHPALQVRQSSKESAHEEDENGECIALCLYTLYVIGVLQSSSTTSALSHTFCSVSEVV